MPLILVVKDKDEVLGQVSVPLNTLPTARCSHNVVGAQLQVHFYFLTCLLRPLYTSRTVQMTTQHTPLVLDFFHGRVTLINVKEKTCKRRMLNIFLSAAQEMPISARFTVVSSLGVKTCTKIFNPVSTRFAQDWNVWQNKGHTQQVPVARKKASQGTTSS